MAHDEAVSRKFGLNLKRQRERAGLSQEELGFRASLHRTEIGMLERGVRLARIDTLVKLAGAIGVPVTELLDGIEWSVPTEPPIVGQFGIEPDGAGRMGSHDG